MNSASPAPPRPALWTGLSRICQLMIHNSSTQLKYTTIGLSHSRSHDDYSPSSNAPFRTPTTRFLSNKPKWLFNIQRCKKLVGLVSLLWSLMAGGGIHRKKKKTERSNPVPHSSMPSLSPTHRHRWLTRGVPLALALCILVLLGVSSNAWVASPHISQKFQSHQIYTIDVVNEFPHDPKAFTQVRIFF